MTLLPVITRELRAASRQSFTYNLRLLGLGAAVAICAVATFGPAFSQGGGARVFGYLHFTLFCAIWILVPILTSDCLSRERREGTLPLLFLTPLKPAGIVLAKGMAQFLRAFTLWLAVLPVMTIPFLLGGVGWRECLISMCLNCGSILLALAIGMVASSICSVWRRAAIFALILSLLTAVLFAYANGFLMLMAIRRVAPVGKLMTGPIWQFAAFAAQLISDLQGIWSAGMANLPLRGQRAWLGAEVVVLLLCLVAAMAAVAFAAWRLKKVWRKMGHSARMEKISRVMNTPIIGQSTLRRSLSRHLAKNPIGWLERRKLGGRLVGWGWLGVLGASYALVEFADGFNGNSFDNVEAVVAWLLATSLAMAAATSFRSERENGFLELLLISPLGEWQIIGGRLRVLWGRFLPVVVIFLMISIWQAHFFGSGETRGFLPYLVLIYVTAPVIGLYFSLARRQFMPAMLWTLFFGGFVPFAMGRAGAAVDIFSGALGMPIYEAKAEDFGFAFAAVIQLALAGTFAFILHEHLSRRRFVIG